MQHKSSAVLCNDYNERILLHSISYKTHKLMIASFAFLHVYLIKKQMMIIQTYSMKLKIKKKTEYLFEFDNFEIIIYNIT
tara:strand:+ start:1068 stop:1307 length:240 start_codon:yes stop_codon:yes gene_type:complete